MADTPLERPADARAAAARARSALRSETGLALLTLGCLALIVLMGAALRFRELGWDQPAGAHAPLQMHPDERYLSIVQNALDWPDSLAGYFNSQTSPLSPYNTPEGQNYVYGTLPLFLGKALATVAGDDPSGTRNSYDTTVVWGRRLTAFTDTLTIILVFGIGLVAFGRATGLAGGGLYALAVLPTQLAHFWTMDPYFTFFAALTLLLCMLAIQRDSWWLLPAAGVSIGLAMACKVNAGLLTILPLLVVAARIGLRDFHTAHFRWRGERILPGGNWALDGAGFCFAIIGALIAFRIAAPYAFAGTSFFDFGLSQHWLDVNRAELERQDGKADFPPFVQFAGNSLFLTPLKTLVLWGMGPALGTAAVAASIVAAVLLFRRRELTFILPLAMLAAIFGFHGMRFVAFMRYFQPMYPALCVFAGWAVVAGATWAAANRHTQFRLGARTLRITPLGAKALGGGLAALVILGTAWWALAFQNVYTAEHPRITASRWMYENIEPGSKVTYELWDDALPYPLPGYPRSLVGVELEPYRTDSVEKVRALIYGLPGREAEGLEGADYVVISSNRIRDSIPRLEREYPATIRYYQLLETGELGFERVATFRVEPSFLGISINDQGAEESFTVYDHPEVRIYQKTAAWDAEAAFALLLQAYPDRAVNLTPGQGRTNALLYTAAEAERQQASGTWTSVFNPDGWASGLPWLWWLLWLQLAAFASVPWVTWALRALPDRGYGLTKVAGQAIVGLAVWLLVAWDVVDFSRALVWTVFLAALAIGLAGGYLRRAALREDARDRWRTVVAVECVFLLAFFGFLALRAWNPDLWWHPRGGEKPMEVAYLTAVTRSAEFPPYDPWFAGGYLNYYYMGWFFMAVPMRAFQVVPEVGFNLGVPMFASMAAAAAFSTVLNLTSLTAGLRASAPRFPSMRTLLLAGALGAFFLVAIGNFDGLHQTVERLQAVNTWTAFEGVPVLGGAVGIAGGLWEWAFGGASLPPYDWWRSSRVHFGSFDITEFPYWTFLFSDVHPHLMAIPFFGLLVGLALGYATTAARTSPGASGLPASVLAAALGLVTGLMRAVHTWDFPTAILITAAAIAVGQLLATGSGERRFWRFAGHGAIAAACAIVPFIPFAGSFETFSTSLQRTPETTQPQQYFSQFGIFVIFALVFIAVRYHELLRTHPANPLLLLIETPLSLGAFAVFIAGLITFTWPLGVTVVAVSAVILVFLANLAWVDLRSRTPDVGRLLATLALFLALAIAAGVDIVRVGDDIVRMNTVFKFSMQAWHLFALGAAYAAWYVAWGREPLPPRPGRNPRRTDAALARLFRLSYATLAVVLVLSGSVFLWSGTRERQGDRFFQFGPTLNGLAYLDRDPTFMEGIYTQDPNDDTLINLNHDLPLINWLRQNVEGSPVIVESPGPGYTWATRIAINTGLPTVIGWEWHQVQQRTGYAWMVHQRREETTRFFLTTDTLEAGLFLRKYNVTYVIVGTEERVYYPAESLAKFDSMEALTPVFRDRDSVIYEIDPALLPVPGLVSVP